MRPILIAGWLALAVLACSHSNSTGGGVDGGTGGARSCLPDNACDHGPTCGSTCCGAGEACVDGACVCGTTGAACTGGNVCGGVPTAGGNRCGSICCGASSVCPG